MDIQERFFLNLKDAMDSFDYLLHTSKKLATNFGAFNHFSKPATIDQDDLSKLKLKLEAIQATLKKADGLGLSDDFDRLWMRELRDLEYRAEDVVEQIQFEFLRVTRFDEFRIELLRANKGKRKNQASSLFSSFPAGSLNVKIRRIRDRYHEIARHREALRLSSEDGARRPQASPLVQTSSFTESKLHGRKADLNKLIKLLSDSTNDQTVYSIIPIVGMAGVGKTTLVQHLYQTVKNQFDIKIWICVSQDLDAVQVTRKIAESLRLPDYELSQQNLIQEAIIDRLNGKKVLLVLDDVWIEDEGHWKSLKAPLKDAAKGSKVIVTTRSVKVSQMVMCTKRLHLGCLSEDDSWSVCFERAQNGRLPNLESNMIDIGRKVAARCKGLPLAAEAVGAALSLELNEKHWNGVLESYLLTEDKTVGKILPALRVSYEYLPLHLKYCFGYCSLFPKGYVFEKDKLVQLWMAQGFIHPNRSNSLEEIGCGYFDDLLELCFFHHSPSHFISEGKYVMHDLYHELAETVSGKEYDRNEDTKIIKKLDEKRRHSSIVCQEANSNEAIQLGSFGCDDLRTFLFVGENKDKSEGVQFSMNIPRDLFSLLEGLRALDLGNTDINNLPNTIGRLIHLRYLSLENTKIRVLPESIGGLFNLQTLNLKHCYDLEELPKGMKLLDNLRHLHLPSGGSCDISMPAGMGQMTSLQTLPLIVVKSETDKCGLEELGSLENLKGELHVSGMNNIADVRFAEEANMQNKNKLEKLTLEWSDFSELIKEPVSEVLEKLKPHHNLQELIIKGFCGNSFPSWLGDEYLLKLTTLEIKNCINTVELPCLGRLPSLRYLCIQSMAKLKRIGSEFCGHASSSSSSSPSIVGFPKLETLVFKKMDSLEEWSGVEKGDYPCMKSLVLNGCEKLHRVPRFPKSVNVKAMRCPSLKVSENKPEIQNKQMNHYCPLLVLSDCGSKFEVIADPFQEMQTPNNQVRASNGTPSLDSDDIDMAESENGIEEATIQVQEIQTPNNQVQVSNSSPCSDFDIDSMVESGSKLEETTAQEMQAHASSNSTPCSNSDDANMVENGTKLEKTTVQEMQEPNSQVQVSSNNVVAEFGNINEKNTIKLQVQINMVKDSASNTPYSCSDDMIIEANAISS
ncbi:hypothetical protein LUZ60_016304 [Juncus effusus]|nr:hypothetical protein LUZ60_016304 [Juncus effusus]